MEPISSLVSNIGVTGLLGWFMWYTTSVMFPRLQDKQNATIEKVCADFTQTIREERLIRREEIQMLRDELRQTRCEHAQASANHHREDHEPKP